MTVRFRPASLVQTHRVKVMNRNKVTLLTERQREVLALVDQVGRAMALREILAELGSQINKRGLREDLATLEARSLVTPTGHGRGARWKRSAPRKETDPDEFYRIGHRPPVRRSSARFSQSLRNSHQGIGQRLPPLDRDGVPATLAHGCRQRLEARSQLRVGSAGR